MKLKDNEPFFKNPMNYIYSYHGASLNSINSLISKRSVIKQQSENNLLKVVYKDSNQIWNRCVNKWRKSSDICVNLGNPFSRLDNSYKMIRR